jgi:hypothetical protein
MGKSPGEMKMPSISNAVDGRAIRMAINFLSGNRSVRFVL